MTKVHLITGFLGTGKTTAILHLLAHKPEHEKWAVLVNEFGEIGIDGAILKTTGVAVREVPGGCLCCVSGLPFQMGLNLLLAREKPDVLLIEPTGLGHPSNILKTLLADQYQEIIQLGATLCLLDPRQLSDPRYLEQEVFSDQIRLADVLVANKTDLCSVDDQENFLRLADSARPAKARTAWLSQGQLPLDLLQAPFNPQRMAAHPDAHAQAAATPLRILLPLAEHEAFRRLENSGQGFYSVGWLLKPQPVFCAKKLRDWLSGLTLERAKGILCTDEGALIINMRDGVLSEMPTRQLDESRLELIDSTAFDIPKIEAQLLACLLDDSSA